MTSLCAVLDLKRQIETPSKEPFEVGCMVKVTNGPIALGCGKVVESNVWQSLVELPTVHGVVRRWYHNSMLRHSELT